MNYNSKFEFQTVLPFGDLSGDAFSMGLSFKLKIWGDFLKFEQSYIEDTLSAV